MSESDDAIDAQMALDIDPFGALQQRVHRLIDRRFAEIRLDVRAQLHRVSRSKGQLTRHDYFWPKVRPQQPGRS